MLYKMKGLDQMPNDWDVDKLGNIANYINGKAFKPEDWGKTGLPIIRIDQMNNPDNDHDYYNGEVEKEYLLKNGDLLFSWSATLKAMIWNRGPAVLNQHIFKVVPEKGISKYFLFHLLNFNIDSLAVQSHGSTMKHIKKGDLKNFEVPIPTFPEQQKIGDILSTTDRTIEKTEVIIEKLKSIKKGLMQDLLTCGIDENGSIRSEETHRFKESELGKIPEEWEIKKLGDCTTTITQGPNPDYSYTDLNPKYRALKTKDIYDNVIHYDKAHYLDKHTFEKCKNAVLKDGDILLALVGKGSIGKVNMFKEQKNVSFIYTRALGLIRVDKKQLYDYYLLQYLWSSKGKKVIDDGIDGSTSQEVIRTSYIKNILIPFPPLHEQQRIANILSSMDERIRKEEAYRDKLLKTKKALMQDLLTGKVRVNTDGVEVRENEYAETEAKA